MFRIALVKTSLCIVYGLFFPGVGQAAFERETGLRVFDQNVLLFYLAPLGTKVLEYQACEP